MDWGEDGSWSWLCLALKDENDSNNWRRGEALWGCKSRGNGIEKGLPEAHLGKTDRPTCNQKRQIYAGIQCKGKWGRQAEGPEWSSNPFNANLRSLQCILWVLEISSMGITWPEEQDLKNILVMGKTKVEKEK